MEPLSVFPLPLPSTGPPNGYGWAARDPSVMSSTTAFNTGLNERDTFLGAKACVICGNRDVLEHCHITPQAEDNFWTELKARRWVPLQARGAPKHDPRNGMIMCRNHHGYFDQYSFFIRFFPDSALQPFHGRAIALDNDDRHAPFPSLFIIHEMRVRGFNPFNPLNPVISDENPWQEWITTDSVYNTETQTFNRDGPPDTGSNSLPAQPQFQSNTSAGGASSGGRTVALNPDVIADILAATRKMPSWRACQMEGTSWTGTAEENTHRYITSIGMQNDQS